MVCLISVCSTFQKWILMTPIKHSCTGGLFIYKKISGSSTVNIETVRLLHCLIGGQYKNICAAE